MFTNKKLKFRLVSAVTTAMLLLAIVACLFFTLQSLSKGYVSLGGFSVFRVVTGSMEPTISKGALIVSKAQDISTVKQNDIVCFVSDDKTIGRATITHRVINVFTNPDGSTMLQTKGDANPTADSALVSERQFIGRVIKYTGDDSKMSGAIKFITGDFGFIACILLPVIIIAAWIFKDAVKSMKTAIEDMKSQLEDNKSAVIISDEEYKQIEQRIRKELEQDALQTEKDNSTYKSEEPQPVSTSEDA